MRTTTTIIGDYFLKKFLDTHPWFELPKPLEFPSSPYCASGIQRELHTPELLGPDVRSIEEAGNHNNSVQLQSSGHVLSIRQDSVASTLSEGTVVKVCIIMLTHMRKENDCDH